MTSRSAPVTSLAKPGAIERRAWATLIGAVLVLTLFALGSILAGLYIFDNASRARSAQVRIVSGSGAIWRESPDAEWRLIVDSVVLSEGQEISTELGTVVWVTFFDGSTLEISEHSFVRFERMRDSRFSDRVRQIVVRVERGTVYGALAPVEGFDHAEFEVVTNDGRARMVDDRERPNTGTFLVEQHEEESIADRPFRAAVFQGRFVVEAAGTREELTGPSQLVLERDGTVQVSNRILGQLIQNGDFEEGLIGWESVYTASGREPRSAIGNVEAIVPATAEFQHAIRISRPDSGLWARTGIRQRVDRTLRLPASLTLSFDLRIEHQGPPLDGGGTVPLAVELAYIDVLGQERVWRSAYTLRNDEGRVDADIVTNATAVGWTHVIVDLHNIEPIPKTLSTVVVYASGTGYLSKVANLSLTTGEGSVSP